MNTIATINDTLLPVILFIIYFIIASVIRYNLKEKALALTQIRELQQSPETFTYKDAFSANFDPKPEEEISASVQLKSVEENSAPVVTQKAVSQSIPEIIDRLGKRELHKLCSPLGIKQKTNGIELTTEFMKAIVKRKFDENPQKVTQLISVREACRRQSRLPQLLATLPDSNQQQPLEILAC